MEEVHLRVLDTENMEHGHPRRGKRDNHNHHEEQSAVTSVAGIHHQEDQSAVTSAAGYHHHHEDQRIAGKHREFVTENGCHNGGGKAMASLNRKATMHAPWQLADA